MAGRATYPGAEQFLPGREYCVAVGGRVVCRGGRLEELDEPFAFSALERKLGPGEDIFTAIAMAIRIVMLRVAVLVPAQDSRPWMRVARQLAAQRQIA